MIRLFSALRARVAAVRAGGDDRGSLVLAMLVTLVATSVAALILPLFLVSTQSARFDDTRARQLSAAQGGVEATLARIRAASLASSATTGSRALLPCAPVTGTVTGEAKLRFRATVAYYILDPAGLTAAQRISQALKCVVNFGPRSTPAYATITSVGTEAPGNGFPTGASRTVSATYVVRTTSPNVSGGNLRVAILKNNPSTLWCVAADSRNPVAGSTLHTATCDANAAAQMFAYTPTLQLVLTASRTAARPNGLCISSPPGAAQSVGQAVSLVPCATEVTQQIWSFNYVTQWEGTQDGKGTDGLVLHPAADTAGSIIQLAQAKGVANKYRWDPDFRVGAGAAGATRKNLVNFGEFGRCLDVDNFRVNHPYLIDWPCKQSPNADEPTNWNQAWYWTEPGLSGPQTGAVYTVAGSNVDPGSAAGKTYCLTDPGKVDAETGTTPCADPRNPAANQRWRVVGASTGSYATSYRIESVDGTRCLAAKDPTLKDWADTGTNISKIIVAACSSSPLQKWNAPADISTPRVKDQTEN